MPNQVDQVDDWIQTQMGQAGRHPQWCEDLQALYWDHLVHDICNVDTLEYSLWQAAAFRLPLAQAKVSGWWEAPCSLNMLCH